MYQKGRKRREKNGMRERKGEKGRKRKREKRGM